MNLYDDFLALTHTTRIKDEVDGYYVFEETCFYPEHGGMLADQGTINGLDVVDLKWKEGTVYHKVDGTLSDPIVLCVDEQTRVLNTSIQSALHLLEGYYRKLGIHMIATGVDPNHQWYEVDTKDLPQDHFSEVEQMMQEVILQDIPLEITYYEGEHYPDPQYQHLKEVREVKFGTLDTQPCGTLHVNHVRQIGSFVILDHTTTSRGTRVFISVGRATGQRLKAYYHKVQKLRQIVNSSETELVDEVTHLHQQNKAYKKELKQLQEELSAWKAKALVDDPNPLIINQVAVKEMRPIAQAMLRELTEDKYLLTQEGQITYITLISPNQQARAHFEALKASLDIQGGGSPTIVSCKVEEDINVVQQKINSL